MLQVLVGGVSDALGSKRNNSGSSSCLAARRRRAPEILALSAAVLLVLQAEQRHCSQGGCPRSGGPAELVALPRCQVISLEAMLCSRDVQSSLATSTDCIPRIPALAGVAAKSAPSGVLGPQYDHGSQFCTGGCIRAVERFQRGSGFAPPVCGSTLAEHVEVVAGCRLVEEEDKYRCKEALVRTFVMGLAGCVPACASRSGS
mmetsp:Transcript_64081/g.121385  ORF Transcript_64081/g.121385 Transcript_64081/m.121385 type:complete len:202 (+) Transcript_64081:1713-2318(+)